jgi:hypothetical protein
MRYSCALARMPSLEPILDCNHHVAQEGQVADTVTPLERNGLSRFVAELQDPVERQPLQPSTTTDLS